MLSEFLLLFFFVVVTQLVGELPFVQRKILEYEWLLSISKLLVETAGRTDNSNFALFIRHRFLCSPLNFFYYFRKLFPRGP